MLSSYAQQPRYAQATPRCKPPQAVSHRAQQLCSLAMLISHAQQPRSIALIFAQYSAALSSSKQQNHAQPCSAAQSHTHSPQQHSKALSSPQRHSVLIFKLLHTNFWNSCIKICGPEISTVVINQLSDSENCSYSIITLFTNIYIGNQAFQKRHFVIKINHP